MSKANVKVHTIIDKVYENGFCFVHWEKKELEKFMRENDLSLDEIEDDVDAFCLSKGCDSYIFVFIDDVSIMAHECLHAAQHALDYRGVPTCNSNTEGVAYLMQWILQECINFFSKHLDWGEVKQEEKPKKITEHYIRNFDYVKSKRPVCKQKCDCKECKERIKAMISSKKIIPLV